MRCPTTWPPVAGDPATLTPLSLLCLLHPDGDAGRSGGAACPRLCCPRVIGSRHGKQTACRSHEVGACRQQTGVPQHLHGVFFQNNIGKCHERRQNIPVLTAAGYSTAGIDLPSAARDGARSSTCMPRVAASLGIMPVCPVPCGSPRWYSCHDM